MEEISFGCNLNIDQVKSQFIVAKDWLKAAAFGCLS